MKKSVHKKKHHKKSSFNQRGKGKLLPIIIVAAVIILGAGAFYFFNQQSGGSLSIPGMRPALNPNCELNDPELCKYYNNYVNMPKNYTLTSTGNYGDISGESVMIFDGENYQMITKQGDKEISNMISIGDTMYTKDYSDNAWWKYTAEPSEVEEDETEPINIEEELVKDTTKYTFVGKEACGDLTCFKYEITLTESTDGSKQFILFDDREYLTRKVIIQNSDGSILGDSVYTYNNAKVSVPSPVKEGDPYSAGAGAGAAGGYNEVEMRQMMEQYQQQMPDMSSYDQEMPIDSSEYEY